MMRISAFLNSENVPIDVINPGFPELDQEELRECARSTIDIASVLKVLSSYSLYSVDRQNKVFSVHKLVQEVVRASLTQSQRVETLVAATRVLHYALQTKYASFSKQERFTILGPDLSLFTENERNILIALVLNFRKLKNHIEDEFYSSKGNVTFSLYNDNTYQLCSLVIGLIATNIFLNRLRADVDDFRFKVAKMCRSLDPNKFLWQMVSTSLSLRNCQCEEKYQEAKKMAQEAVQKLSEMEKSGTVINPDIKFMVGEHMASYYALEYKWEKNYKALLELEALPLSDDNWVYLQILIGRAENYTSASNFQCALKRYEKALKLARRIYTPDHHQLLRVLQFIAFHWQQEGNLVEARKYAEEMLPIAKKQPPTSDFYIRGITDALLILSHFEPRSAENTLLRIFEDRWPVMYRSIQTGEVDGLIDTDEHVFHESSYNHAAMVLDGVIKCFQISNSSVKHKKARYDKSKGNLYRRIAELVVSLKTKMYGESHLEVLTARCKLAEVHKILGVKDEASGIREKVRQFYEEPVNDPSYSKPQIDVNVLDARKCKDIANDFFKEKDYLKALQIYEKLLNRFPNDVKLLTNRAATYVKLSEQNACEATEVTESQRRLLKEALRDAEKAVVVDPSWAKGYYWKAVCLAKLGQRGPSLAATAVAEHVFPSQCTDIPAVINLFGEYSKNVITTVDGLYHAAKRADSNNLVILLKEGRYELPKSLKVPANAVMVGVGKVQIIFPKSVPLKLDETVYTENIELLSSTDSIKIFKEKAKESLNRGQLDEALSLYSKAIAICPEDAQLLTARASTYLKSAEGKRNMSERVSLLELAFKDSESSIRADPSWLLGYSTKATILAELGRKHEALAAAAVFNHLSSGRDISSVIERYGALQIDVVKNSDELRNVLQEITEREVLNQTVLLNEGDYQLEKTVEMNQAIVVVGLGKVTVSCKTGVPLHFRKEHCVENVALHNGCGEEPTSHEAICSRDDSGQEEVISLDLPSGYDSSSANSECKVN